MNYSTHVVAAMMVCNFREAVSKELPAEPELALTMGL
jgi:hypothetical protein